MTDDRVEIEIWNVALPLGSGIETVAGVFTHWWHLLVLLRDTAGRRGAGYAHFHLSPPLRAATERARELIEACGPSLSGLIGVERVEASLPGATSSERLAAASALSLAAWDLAGRRAGLACADLWGREPARAAIPAYASGFFLDASPVELAAEANRWRDQGYRRVKMRTGKGVAEDLARLAIIRETYPGPGAVAADAVNSWSVAEARAFIAGSGVELLWVEDPTPYAAVAELRGAGAPIAGGESLERAAALLDLFREGGVSYLLLDVQRLGGPQRFLEAAHRLGAEGARIGAHMFPHYSAHLLAAVAEPLPVEVLDWSGPLFAPALALDAEGRLPVGGPGFGVTVRAEALEQFGELIARF